MIPFKFHLVVTAGLLLLFTVSTMAHDPVRHGFSMVSFKRPFPAPDFTSTKLNGTQLKLSEYRGGHVLLNFWATWCPPCLEEMPSMEALYKAYKNRGFTVLAISSDQGGAEVVSRFIDKIGVSFPVLLDPDGKIAAKYGAKNLPVSFLIGPDGQVEAAAQGARDWASKAAMDIIDERLRQP